MVPDLEPSLSATPIGAIASACARIASCAHPHDPPQWRNPSACVDYWISHAGNPDVPACLSTATTCAALGACLHPGRGGPAAEFCRAHPGALTGCSGTSLVTCNTDDPDEGTALDCATVGARCGDLAQAGGLSTHACIDPARCPPELTRSWCADRSSLMSCHDGEIERVPCSAGWSCREHAEPNGDHAAMCEGNGHFDCTTPGEKRCDGPLLVECETHGHFAHAHVVDCEGVGLVCAATDGRAACTRPSPECRDGHPRCDGPSIAFCAAGQRVTVDCGTIGLGPCLPDGRGPEATCQPPAEAR